MTPAPVIAVPIANHEVGTSVAATSSSWPLAFELRPKPLKARAMVRHCIANARSPDETMIGTPSHTPISFHAFPGALVAYTRLFVTGLVHAMSWPHGPIT